MYSPHLRADHRKITPGQIGYLYRRVTEIHQVSLAGLAGLAEKVNFNALFAQQLRDTAVQ